MLCYTKIIGAVALSPMRQPTIHQSLKVDVSNYSQPYVFNDRENLYRIVDCKRPLHEIYESNQLRIGKPNGLFIRYIPIRLFV